MVGSIRVRVDTVSRNISHKCCCCRKDIKRHMVSLGIQCIAQGKSRLGELPTQSKKMEKEITHQILLFLHVGAQCYHPSHARHLAARLFCPLKVRFPARPSIAVQAALQRVFLCLGSVIDAGPSSINSHADHTSAAMQPRTTSALRAMDAPQKVISQCPPKVAHWVGVALPGACLQ